MNDHRIQGVNTLSKVLKNQNQIKKIEELIFQLSNEEEDYKQNVYQTIGDILSKVKIVDIMTSLKKNQIHWNHSKYSRSKQLLEEEDEFLENPFNLEEGVVECHCGSKKVFTYSKQCRSADEPMTTFATCIKCNNRWSYSG